MASPAKRALPIRLWLGLASGICFVCWGVVAAFMAWIVLPIASLWMRGASSEQRMARARAITATGNGWLIWGMQLTRLMNFDARTPLRTPEGPFVLIANHPTLIDVCMLTSRHKQLCVIAKPKMTRSIFVGRALRASGHIEGAGADDSPFGGAAVITAAVERLRQGVPVLIFPEGTRSPPRKLGTFSRGAFEIAMRAKVPLVCAIIRAEPPMLYRGMRWYNLPKETCQYSVELLPANDLAEYGGDSKVAARSLAALIENRLDRASEGRGGEPANATQQAGATS